MEICDKFHLGLNSRKIWCKGSKPQGNLTNFTKVLIAGKFGAKDQNRREICDKFHLGHNSRKIWCSRGIFDKVHLILKSRKIGWRGSKVQENMVQ